MILRAFKLENFGTVLCNLIEGGASLHSNQKECYLIFGCSIKKIAMPPMRFDAFSLRVVPQETAIERIGICFSGIQSQNRDVIR